MEKDCEWYEEEVQPYRKTDYKPIIYIHISESGVFMLLDRIDVSKSSGPDKLPGRLLQSLAKEITPVVHFFLTFFLRRFIYISNKSAKKIVIIIIYLQLI